MNNPFVEQQAEPNSKPARFHRGYLAAAISLGIAIFSGTAAREYDIEELYIATWFSVSALTWLVYAAHVSNFLKGKAPSVFGPGHPMAEASKNPLHFWYSSIVIGVLHVGFGMLFLVMGCRAIAAVL